MKYLLIILMLTSGCAMTEDRDNYINGLNSVNIGDSYEVMIEKIGIKPYKFNCYQSAGYESCTAMYNISAYDRVIFRIDHNAKVASIYY